jgi:hypothetical protein
VPEIALVAPEGTGASELLDGLRREGALTRTCWFGQPDLEQRLLAVRPDAVVFVMHDRAEEETASLTCLADRLRALAVPTLAALHIPPGPVFHPLLLVLDDFVLSPVRADEVLARLHLAAARRGPDTSHLLAAGLLSLDPAGFRAYVSGRLLELTYKEFELLRFLLVNRGKVVSRQAILNHVWGYDFYGGLRTVDAHIRRLRSKIEVSAPGAIETIRNVGYRVP